MRRLGVVTFEYPSKGPQRLTYLWDVKSLAHLRTYAEFVADWTVAEIVEMMWCNEAEAVYRPDKERDQRYMFCLNDTAYTDTQAITGASADGWTLEQSAVLYCMEQRDGLPKQRRISWPAPVQGIFYSDGALDPMVGDVMAHTLRQCTGIFPLVFRSGRLMHFVREQEDRT